MTSRRTRERMVQRLREQGIFNARVLEAMAAVPRHLFVEEALASRAYEDTALPIGFGQTISQPYTVARLTELAIGQRRPEKVLEVGTGSGYQTAVLAHMIFRSVPTRPVSLETVLKWRQADRMFFCVSSILPFWYRNANRSTLGCAYSRRL